MFKGNPLASMQGMAGRMQQFMKDPARFLMRNGLDIPQQYMGSPNDAIQYLMNSGKLSQQQYNWANQQMKALRDNPAFKQFMGGK